MSKNKKDIRKRLKEAEHFETEVFRQSFALSATEKRSLEDLGQELDIPGLTEIFTAAVKAGHRQAQTIAALTDEQSGDLIEELSVAGRFMPGSNEEDEREMQITFIYNRYKPETFKPSLLNISFTQARLVLNHADKETNPDKLAIWASNYLRTPAGEIIVPDSGLAPVQRLMKMLKSYMPDGIKFVTLAKNTALIHETTAPK